MLAFALASCALDAPPVDSVLAAGTPGADAFADDPALALPARGARLQESLDRECSLRLAKSRAAPTDVALATAAAESLFMAADLRMQRALVAALAMSPPRRWQDAVAAEDHLASEVRDAILGLCAEGRKLAEAAVGLAPSDRGALLQAALHLSLVAWANGPTRSLMAGYGPRLVRAIEATVAADPAFDDGAPLRLQGRFLARAPWPYGDSAKAKIALERAAALRSVPVTELFLGDWHAANGTLEDAERHWTKAVTADDAPSTRFSGPFHRELARARLATLRASK